MSTCPSICVIWWLGGNDCTLDWGGGLDSESDTRACANWSTCQVFTSKCQEYYDNTTTEAEHEILLGVMQPEGHQTSVHFLWPTSDILSSYVPDYASGTKAWRIRCKHIFHTIQNEINSGKAQPMNQHQWLRFLLFRGFINQKSTEGDVWLQCHNDFVNLSYHDWHCILLSDLSIS